METTSLPVQSHHMLMCACAGAWHTWMMIISGPGWTGGVVAPLWPPTLHSGPLCCREQVLIAGDFNLSGCKVESVLLGWPCCRSNLCWRDKQLEESWLNRCCLKCHLGVTTAAWANWESWLLSAAHKFRLLRCECGSMSAAVRSCCEVNPSSDGPQPSSIPKYQQVVVVAVARWLCGGVPISLGSA